MAAPWVRAFAPGGGTTSSLSRGCSGCWWVFGGALALEWMDLGPWASQLVVCDVFVAVLTVIPYLV